MATMTDPARELGEIAQRLVKGTGQTGAKFLAAEFGVEPWSTSFYRIISCILERCDAVEAIVRNSNMDEDHIESAIEELDGLKSAFGASSLMNAWNNAGHGLSIVKEHGRPIQYLSTVVRSVSAYPALSDDEIVELIGLIDEYISQLDDTVEPAFVRQAIHDGLTRFRFQLEHVGWMGAGYALSAFRDLALVYDSAIHRHETAELDAEAALGALYRILNLFKTRVEQAKGWADAGNAVWQVLQIGSSVATGAALGKALSGAG